MSSRVVREGTVGLLLLAGVGLISGLVVWLRGGGLGKQSYSLSVEVPDSLGLTVGSPVRFRGVKVGQVKAIQAATNAVTLTVEIQSAQLLIPRQTSIEATQSGFIGQVTLDLRPRPEAAPVAVAEALTPFKTDCDRTLILCDGDRLTGEASSSLDDLIRSTTKLAGQLGEAQLPETLADLSSAAQEFKRLSRSARFTLRTVSTAAISLRQLSQSSEAQIEGLGLATTAVTQAADEFAKISPKIGRTVDQFTALSPKFGRTADQLGQASEQVTTLIKTNRSSLITTITNLQGVSQDLKTIVADFGPLISQAKQSQLLENLERLAANGAAATANLRTLTESVDNPATLAEVTQTLNAARVTFQNAQKITTDLEQLTGNAQFRQNLIRLINELSKLFSSSQALDQQVKAIHSNSSAPLPDPRVTLTGGPVEQHRPQPSGTLK